MEYDLKVGPDTWSHSRFSYRVVYHLGELDYTFMGSLSLNPEWRERRRKHPDLNLDEILELVREENYQKITGYMEQMHIEGQYAIDRLENILHVYCNEWIDDAVLKLACADDKHFIHPAFIEYLDVFHEE